MKMNVQFNDQHRQQIEDTAAYLGTTRANILRIALSLLEIAVREHKQGNSLAVIKGDTVVKEIVGIFT